MSNILNEVQGSIVADHVSNVTTTFTSWDKCMLQSYCKWPAIFGIAVGGIVALSFIICITRCLCCGYSFCCSCFSFLSCCGSCGGCCEGRRRRSDKYRIDHSSDYRNQGYSAPPPMVKVGYDKSQYASFSTNKATSSPLNEDALPAMPSWDTATSVHVLDDTEDSQGVELDQINSSTSQKAPLLTAAVTTGSTSSLIQENNPTPFQIRPLPNQNNGFVNPNDSNHRRVLENPINQYSPKPFSENMRREDGVRYGGSSLPLNGREYAPYLQSKYHEGGRSSPMQVPYHEGGLLSPMQAPYYEGGRSSQMQAPYHEGARSTPVQAQFPEGARSTHPYNQTQFGSPIPGGKTQGREYGQPPNIQRPAMGYQGYRV